MSKDKTLNVDVAEFARIKAENEALKAEAEKQKAELEAKKSESLSIRSETTQNDNAYHTAMKVFKRVMLYLLTLEENQKYIVSRDDNEIVVTSKFKSVVIDYLNACAEKCF